MIVGCQKSMWLLTNVLLVLSISLLQTASSTPTPPERRGLKDILFGKATLPNYSLPSARAPTPSINDQENQQFYQMVMHRKFQTCADFQASLRTLDPLKISQSAFNKALVALDLSTADIHTGFTGKDHEEMFQERTWANWLKKQKNNFVHGDSQHGKNPDRCSKFESATAIMELVGTIGVASSPSTAPPTSSSADSNAAENAVLVRLFDLQEETIESLGKGQVGSYLHRK